MTRAANAAPFMVVLLLASGVAPGSASAQMRGGAVSVTPLGLPLDGVPVGSWAEYQWRPVRGFPATPALRHALVARQKGNHVVELRTRSFQGEKLLTRSVVTSDPTRDAGIKKVVLQIGDSDPMELPVEGNESDRWGPRWIKPEPGTLIGTETVKVAAGTFKAEHHRVEGKVAQTVDYWIAKGPGPYGLIKMEMDYGGAESDRSRIVVLELVAHGNGAKPELTRPAQPFHAETMRSRFFRDTRRLKAAD